MRCLLEDLNIRAIKAGPLYSVEEASILGQILADYPQLPLVLHLQSIPDSAQVGREQDSDAIIQDRKSTRLNSSYVAISYAVFCLKKKNSTCPKPTMPMPSTPVS